jgi:hypothetical protein
MITVNDTSYIDTKNLVLESNKMINEIEKLIAIYSKAYQVKILNIVYEYVELTNSPRIEVVLLERDDQKKFFNSSGIKYEETSIELIKSEFDRMVMSVKNTDLYRYKSLFPQYDSKKVFVTFSAFKPIAISDINNKITKDEIDLLEKQYSDYNIWRIEKFFGSVTFFFYKDIDIENAKKNGATLDMKKSYVDLLKQNDVFGYINVDDYIIMLDSKENFEKTYKGSWYSYYH